MNHTIEIVYGVENNMSNYPLCPSPDLSTKERNFAFWENGFSDDEISRIKVIGDSLTLNQAIVDRGESNTSIRKSKVGWISHDTNSSFIYDKLGYIGRMMNGEFFDLNLYGFIEDIQYTVYQSDDDKYNWHMDKGNLNAPPRKLSLVVQLSDPSEYEGGDFEFLVGPEPITAKKEKGIVYAFPSYIIHRVTPITAGTRKSLVIWFCGDKFR
jgi:PKHD-type hydroxylase